MALPDIIDSGEQKKLQSGSEANLAPTTQSIYSTAGRSEYLNALAPAPDNGNLGFTQVTIESAGTTAAAAANVTASSEKSTLNPSPYVDTSSGAALVKQAQSQLDSTLAESRQSGGANPELGDYLNLYASEIGLGKAEIGGNQADINTEINLVNSAASVIAADNRGPKSPVPKELQL
jgi:hypothetical protein